MLRRIRNRASGVEDVVDHRRLHHRLCLVADTNSSLLTWRRNHLAENGRAVENPLGIRDTVDRRPRRACRRGEILVIEPPTLLDDSEDLALPAPGAILGVVDQRPDTIGEDTSPATAAGSHSVAVDPRFNQVYVPGNNAATSICPGGNGCIAIFMSANDDPGICGGKEETAFKNQVCPGKPGTN